MRVFFEGGPFDGNVMHISEEDAESNANIKIPMPKEMDSDRIPHDRLRAAVYSYKCAGFYSFLGFE